MLTCEYIFIVTFKRMYSQDVAVVKRIYDKPIIKNSENNVLTRRRNEAKFEPRTTLLYISKYFFLLGQGPLLSFYTTV